MTITEITTPTEVLTFAGEYADPLRYDLEYGQDSTDVPFYRSLAEQTTDPVLDVACGTGRVTLALASGGHSMTGVDVDSGMLAHAQRKFGADDIAWVEQDARELRLRAKFGLVIVAGNAFQHFLTNEDRDAVLKAIYRQLKPGGLFAFAIRFPRASELALVADAPQLWHSYLDAEGHQILVSGTAHYDEMAQVMHHQTFRHVATTGAPAATPTTTSLRYHFPQELEAALKAARFQVAERLGSFDGSPLIDGADHLIYVCRKPESTKRSN